MIRLRNEGEGGEEVWTNFDADFWDFHDFPDSLPAAEGASARGSMDWTGDMVVRAQGSGRRKRIEY